MQETTTLAEVDAIVYINWKKLRDDPKADPTACRKKIDYWLDRRLELMNAIQDNQRRREMLSV